jgi:short-subunit dehydrogenase
VRVKGKVVLITGASSGIGEATALEFARRKARLALAARRLDRLQAVADRCRQLGSPEVTVRRTDIGQPREARALVAATMRDFERIDVLVNNAGAGWTGRLHEMPEAQVRSLVDTNLLGMVWTLQSVLPGMLAARSGVVINVASVVGLRPLPYAALYSATKHAVIGLSHALRGELSGMGVKICVVYPAATATEFHEKAGEMATGPVYSAEWVARIILRTTRWPRRDAVVFPARPVQWAEPVLGGLLDHILGENRRRLRPQLAGPGSIPEPPEFD